MTTPSTASNLANAKTKAANLATQTALDAFTRDNRVTAADAHSDAKDQHQSAAEVHADAGHENKATAHALAANHHARLADALRAPKSRESVAQGVRGGCAVPLVKSELDAADVQRAANNLRKGTYIDDATAARKDRTPFEAAQFRNEGAVAASEEGVWEPGDAISLSDEELGARLARGPTRRLSNPRLQSEYEQNAAFAEAEDEKRRRDNMANNTNDALSKPGRTAVQMQTGIPREKVGQMRPATPNANTMRSMESLSDAQLAALVTQAPNTLPYEPTVSDYVNRDNARAAKAEIFRRATDQATGTRVNPTNWR